MPTAIKRKFPSKWRKERKVKRQETAKTHGKVRARSSQDLLYDASS